MPHIEQKVLFVLCDMFYTHNGMSSIKSKPAS